MMGSKARAIIPSCWYFLLHASNRCPLAIVSGYPLGDRYVVEAPEGPAARMNAKAEYAQVFNKCDTQLGCEMEPQHLRGRGPFGRLLRSRIGRLKRDAEGISALHCRVCQKNLQSASPRPLGLPASLAEPGVFCGSYVILPLKSYTECLGKAVSPNPRTTPPFLYFDSSSHSFRAEVFPGDLLGAIAAVFRSRQR